MPYKISLVGTHGTGKTALAASVEGELKKRGVETRTIGEVSTKARERGLPINEGTTLEAQLWILHTQFAKELSYSDIENGRSRYEAIICDRGPDNYCYLENAVGENDYALSMVLGHLKVAPYSEIYLLPIVDCNDLTDNGTRSIDLEFQREMDDKIRSFLSEHNIRHHELAIPKADDNFRSCWVRTIVNDTLRALERPGELYLK